jgi:hypothetical protein
MRTALRLISGLATTIGVLALAWAIAGRPTLDGSRIGSGLQAIGAAVELYAVLLIVWDALIRPPVAKGRERIVRSRQSVRRLLHRLFPKFVGPVVHEVTVGSAIEIGSSMSASVTIGRGGTTEERLERVEREIGEFKSVTARRLEEVTKQGQAAIKTELEAMEARAIEVRTADAARLLLGITLSLIGATWSAVG